MNDFSEDPRERASKYIDSFEIVIRKLALVKGDSVVKAPHVKRVSDTIYRYLEDARYYLKIEKPATALASIAYAEGLLDALAFLKLTKPSSVQ